MKTRRQLHQSGVEMFSRCGMQFYFRYIAGMKRPPSAYILAGSATDKSVSSNLDNKIVSGELLPREVCTDIARDYIENAPDAKDIQLDPEDAGKSVVQVLGEAKDKAARLSGTHWVEAAPAIKPFRTQRKFTINLDKFLRARARDLYEQAEESDISSWRKRVLQRQAEALNAAARDGLDFVGEQDIVEKYQITRPGAGFDESNVRDVLTIRDTKTSKKSPSATTAHDTDQLTSYAIASKIVDGKLPDAMILDYLVDLKGGVKYVLAETTRNDNDVDVYLNRLAITVASVRQGVFAPTSQTNWACDPRYCGYTAICPAFKQPKSVTVTRAETLEGNANDAMPKKPELVKIQSVQS